MRKLTTEEVKQKIATLFNNTLDTSKVEYVNTHTPITLICLEHGEFKTTTSNLWDSPCGCPSCSRHNRKRENPMTTERLIREYMAKHNGRYTYDKVVYRGQNNKVIITCPIHGDFLQKPYHHLDGHGCPECAGLKPLTTETFIARAKEKHGNDFDYSKVEYINYHTKVCIICHEHGEFWQSPNAHLRGQKCPMCSKSHKDTISSFVEKAKKVHGGKYDYSKVIYSNSKTNVVITCPIHGDFSQAPDKHLVGQGCPICKESHLERHIRLILQTYGIPYESQSNINGLLEKQSVDFYIPQFNLAIECQGKQHFGIGGWINEDFDDIYYRDVKKSEILSKNGVNIAYYTNEDENTVLPHQTNLYTKENTYFNLSFLNQYIPNNTIVKSISDEIKDYFSKFKVDIIENHSFNNILINLFFPQFNFGINIIDINTNTEWKYNVDRHQLLNNTNICHDHNIKLIQLFSDEWSSNKTLVLNKIQHILQQDYNKPSIYGRQCDIREISNTSASSFLDINHIQGSVAATIYLGAFHNDLLVGVMTFKKENNNKWELSRFASDNNYRCIGLGGKLFKYFIREYNPSEIKSFADKRWTVNYESNLYTQLGFDFVDSLQPNYYYCNSIEYPNMRFHKFGFRKDRLHRKYGLSMHLTESEMVKQIGYDRLWDCGLLKYVWSKP